ncbi:GtrA family protein [Dokdonella fugitiva]|jgi:putative flippase GtrA|uniref:Putative flippase GtrA n=1 Tax=Dokdonella fugitiva TaxID=328517 RepID=A0A4R2IBH6_9GAMM|nr:GtrA family protein [Dokdonella fugitiva]MBA8883873.1 putative flippase GtrA [Dokdonella fugitiva]TCO41861.1 putative flippase GtrA [Dokdonella fugitiva]
MALRRQILLFAVSGVLGFVVDAGIVQFLVRELGANPYGARVVSFLAAATTTWGFNRTYTFAGHGGGSRRRQLVRYLVAMAFGFALNYGAYVACVLLWPLVRQWPAIGVAAGSVAGALVNFLSSKYWIFRPLRPAPAGDADDDAKSR